MANEDIPVASDAENSEDGSTCPCTSTGQTCVRSCRGVPDGDYQSCQCCHGTRAYISCSGGRFYRRPCPANLVWADDIKQCNYTSSTCKECEIYDIEQVRLYKCHVLFNQLSCSRPVKQILSDLVNKCIVYLQDKCNDIDNVDVLE